MIAAVILAVAGVACGLAPYFATAKIIVLLLAGEKTFAAYTPWQATALIGYLARTVLYNSALSVSHKPTLFCTDTLRGFRAQAPAENAAPVAV